MEFLIAVPLVLAVPVCAIAGFVLVLKLRARTEILERRLLSLETQLAAGLARPPASDLPEAEARPAEEPVPIPVVSEPPAVEPSEPLTPELPPIAAPSPELPPAPARAPSLEERLGTRWTVWVGGVALALGGLFLVRYSIEQGLLGPGARVATGALFALLLAAAGEALRRRGGSALRPGVDVPAVLTAAGTSTAFATTYAAYALYGLVGPGVAFALLGVIAVLTMVAAALHGPGLAALGLVAALASPLLVESEAPSAWPLVPYLAFVVLAAYGVARLRLWKWLAVAGAAGGAAWGLVLILLGSETAPMMAHVAMQTVLAALFLVADVHRGEPDGAARPDRLAAGVLLALSLVALLVVAGTGAGAARPLFSGALALGLAGLAWRFPAFAPGAALSFLVAAGTLLLWPVAREAAAEPLLTYPDFAGLAARPDAVGAFLAFAALISGAVSAASLARLARGRDLPLTTAAWFAGAAAVGPLAVLVVAYGRVALLDHSLPFAAVAGGLALLFTLSAGALRRIEGGARDGVWLGVGATAAAAVAALALGLTFALDKGMLTVAFALAALGAAFVADRTGIDALRKTVGALGLLVLARLAWDPTIVGGDPGPLPILNWLLWGYGVPALAFFGASRLLERQGRDAMTRLAESLALVFAALLVTFEIRHALRPVGADLLAPTAGLMEAGLVATTALLFSLVLVRVDALRPDSVYHVGSLAFGVISFALVALGLLVTNNPLIMAEPVPGGPVLNALLLGYAVPAAAALALALTARGRRPRWYVLTAAGLGAALHFVYTVAEVRRLFQGEFIHFDVPATQGEQWALSLALLATGILLLALGLWRNIRLLRLLSGAYVLLAVAKVFVVDLANLEGAMRAFSFIGLGFALVGIGLAYQKLLARRGTGGEAPA